jgi:hypothetical protein
MQCSLLGRLQESIGNRETWPYGARDNNVVLPMSAGNSNLDDVAADVVDDAGVGLDNNNGNDAEDNALDYRENEARNDNDLYVDENVARDDQSSHGHINHNDAWQGVGENVAREDENIEENHNNEEDDNIAVVSDDDE